MLFSTFCYLSERLWLLRLPSYQANLHGIKIIGSRLQPLPCSKFGSQLADLIRPYRLLLAILLNLDLQLLDFNLSLVNLILQFPDLRLG